MRTSAMVCAPPVPQVRTAHARENDTGCRCAPRGSRRAHRRGGASRSARTSCASRSRGARAAGTVRAGPGATPQSKGLLRVRGRARLRTPGPSPSGRSRTSDPWREGLVQRRYKAAEQAFAVHPSVGAAAILVANRFAGRALVVRRDRAIHSPLRYVDSNVSVSHPNHRLGFNGAGVFSTRAVGQSR